METDNQNSRENTTPEERTFTQAEVNSFLKKDREKMEGKFADYEALKEKAAKYDELEEANKSEIQKANEKAAALEKELSTLKKANEVREIRDRVAKETGVPYSLLTAETEDECRTQAQAVLDYKQASYPTVRDGGEVQGSSKHSTKEQFAEYFNSILGG